MAEPYVYTKPYLSLDNGTTDHICMANEVSLTVETQRADAETFCYPGLERAGLAVWTFTANFKIGYGAAESWQVLDALAGTQCSVILRPNTAVVGVTNPQAAFTIDMPYVNFLEASMTSAGNMPVTAVCIGDPVFTTV